jgi:hypothetical protein
MDIDLFCFADVRQKAFAALDKILQSSDGKLFELSASRFRLDTPRPSNRGRGIAIREQSYFANVVDVLVTATTAAPM